MMRERGPCPYHLACEVEARGTRMDLAELKERVQRLETTLARGVLLLVANLAGIATVLARQVLGA